VRERLRLLDETLTQLPPNVRRALLMSRVEELTFAQIAAELDVSESMVAKYIAQALRVCRDRLRQADEEI
jgi:RNA polymerase sigma factor (sigma-70 family)